jgi:hypothetical protein
MFTPELRVACNLKNYYLKQWRRTRLNFDKNLFVQARKKFECLLRQERIKYDSRKFSPHLPTRVLFSNLRKCGLKSSPHSLGIEISPETFNKHFTEPNPVDVNPRSNSNTNYPGHPSFFWTDDDEFSFINVTQHDVESACREIKSVAVGVDELPITFIINLLPIILPFVTYIINNCFTQSYFPALWKHAKVIPLAKKANSDKVEDFRPISILPCLSKVFEVLIRRQMSNYLHSKQLLTPLQSGFRMGHSTTTAMLKVVDDITSALELGHYGLLVALDFSRAFDLVPHDNLITKLKHNFGFSTSAIALMQ